MANAVVVTVSSKVVGSGFVVPYNHHEGLQLHRPAPGRPVQPVLYQVPIYEVRVEDAGTYKAVRFALRIT